MGLGSRWSRAIIRIKDTRYKIEIHNHEFIAFTLSLSHRILHVLLKFSFLLIVQSLFFFLIINFLLIVQSSIFCNYKFFLTFHVWVCMYVCVFFCLKVNCIYSFIHLYGARKLGHEWFNLVEAWRRRQLKICENWCLEARILILNNIANIGRYILVRQQTGTRTACYRMISSTGAVFASLPS